jgi:adenylate cyclase
VQIQADAVEQLAAGRVPLPLAHGAVLQGVAVLLIGIFAIVLGTALSPIAGTAILIGALALMWTAALAALGLADRLVDPLTPSIAAVLVFSTTAGTAYSLTRRRETVMRRRLEQHLPPAVVRRLVEQPDLVRLSGERREITSLFTDIESFTATMHRAGPEELVATLDRYFEGVAGIVIDYGGMVDKIVGDGLHVLFNVPLDLEHHPQRAVECAIAIVSWSEAFRRGAPAAAIELGRTRIGIETGTAVVGDVGIRSKLDYTAHGDAVNMAARLEARNKDLGTAICVGPAAAARCDKALLRPLGQFAIRGRAEPIEIFEPWPSDMSPACRESYLAAYGLLDHESAQAALMVQKLTAERPLDQAVRRLSERLRTTPPASPDLLEKDAGKDVRSV